MTFELKACPKPPRRKPKARKGLTRVAMRCGAASKRRKGSSFPKQRDAKYTTWLVTEHDCMLAGRFTKTRLTLNDLCAAGEQDGLYRRVSLYAHRCWRPEDRLPREPAHVGKHRSKGAADLGCTVPLCPGAHDFYDYRRSEWAHATGYTEPQMASAASGYALRWVDRGGPKEDT